MQTRRPLVVNNRAEQGAWAAMAGTDLEPVESAIVPILRGDRVLGLDHSTNYERENAFGEAEVRLLSTVAASMGVALENARLFDETQRLLEGNRAAQRRAGGDQQHPAGSAPSSISRPSSSSSATSCARSSTPATSASRGATRRRRRAACSIPTSMARRWRSPRCPTRSTGRSIGRCCRGSRWS